MAADIPRHQNGITGLEVAYRDAPALFGQREGADPAGVDKDLVGRPLGTTLVSPQTMRAPLLASSAAIDSTMRARSA